DVGRPAAWWVVKGLTAAFALAVVFLCRWPVTRDPASRRGWAFAAECSLVVLGMLLFSERTWKHHGGTLLLPCAVLAYCPFAPGFGRRLRFYLAATLLAVGLLTVVPGTLPARAADLAMVYGTHTLAFLLLTAAVCVLLANVSRVSRESQASA